MSARMYIDRWSPGTKDVRVSHFDNNIVMTIPDDMTSFYGGSIVLPIQRNSYRNQVPLTVLYLNHFISNYAGPSMIGSYADVADVVSDGLIVDVNDFIALMSSKLITYEFVTNVRKMAENELGNPRVNTLYRNKKDKDRRKFTLSLMTQSLAIRLLFPLVEHYVLRGDNGATTKIGKYSKIFTSIMKQFDESGESYEMLKALTEYNVNYNCSKYGEVPYKSRDELISTILNKTTIVDLLPKLVFDKNIYIFISILTSRQLSFARAEKKNSKTKDAMEDEA